MVKKLIQNIPILDVRAPIEFAQGALPNSVNIPILNDEERARVGTCYKNQGREAAIHLGHKIVSDENKSLKLTQWIQFFNRNPQALLTCFRGGLRSQITQSFLQEVGISVERIEGGYKSIRQLYLDQFSGLETSNIQIRVLTGETGSGKTKIIRELGCLDLEALAAHRGSAFGKLSWPQPSQATFENHIAHHLLDKKSLILEDESRVIGSLHLPENLFLKMRQAPVVRLLESLEQRVENIFEEYILDDPEIYLSFEKSIQKITKKLGQARAAEILKDIQSAREHRDAHRIWIEKLLVWYYDPLYRYSLDLRRPRIDFVGSSAEVKKFLVS